MGIRLTVIINSVEKDGVRVLVKIWYRMIRERVIVRVRVMVKWRG